MAPPKTLTFAERRQKWDVKLSPFGFISPYFLIFGVFGLFPLLYTAWVSLQKRNLIDAESAKFIGLGNYDQLLFHDPYFWNAMGNTVSLWLLTTIPQILFALGMLSAYDLNLYTVGLLGYQVAEPLSIGRPVLALLLAPLFLVAARRREHWKIALSRKATFQSLSLVAIGLYREEVRVNAWV